MQNVLQDRRMVLVFAVSALFSLVLLTSVISRMDFHPSEPIGSATRQEENQSLNMAALVREAAEVPFWQQLVFWMIAFFLILLIASLLNPELRNRLIRAFLRLAIFVLLLLYLIKNQPELFAGLFARLPVFGNPLVPKPQVNNSTPPVFIPPQDVNWLSFAVTLGIIILAILIIWQLNRVLARIRGEDASRKPLEDFARIARDSLTDLRSGKSYENAILECYDRMSDIVAKRQGLQRAHQMTPSEFAARLSRAGLPREPIQILTGLFESVRYGKQPVGQVEIDQAISSLTAIAAYCGETV